MEIDFETWKQLVEGAKITKPELKSPKTLYLEFDTGMVCYITADAPLDFDFNWLQGYEPLAKPAIKLYVRKLMEEEARSLTKKRNHGYFQPRKQKVKQVGLIQIFNGIQQAIVKGLKALIRAVLKFSGRHKACCKP